MANLLSRAMRGIRQLPHRIMSDVDRTSVNVPVFGAPPARGNADEREAERRREREVWRRGVEDDDPRK